MEAALVVALKFRHVEPASLRISVKAETKDRDALHARQGRLQASDKITNEMKQEESGETAS
jgi:hypothetical protein